MTRGLGPIPEGAYGVVEREHDDSPFGVHLQELVINGFTVLGAGFGPGDRDALASAVEEAHQSYVAFHGHEQLSSVGEAHTVRALLATGGSRFAHLALAPKLLELVGAAMRTRFILNQQNAIINPAREPYRQGLWHRDLPYQHYVSSRPLAVNALYCVDDFTAANGATWLLPGTHRVERFPSPSYVRTHAMQAIAPAGSFLVLDCMIFHAGGWNSTDSDRRGVNHVYTLPSAAQQVSLAGIGEVLGLDPDNRAILGDGFGAAADAGDYIRGRIARLR